jgi:hypothetical protein
VLESLFGTPTIEQILFFIFINKTCYPSQLKKVFAKPLYSFQNALGRLERGGIIVSSKVGKTLVYQFNPRYPFIKELETLLQKAYQFLPDELREKYYEPPIRKRPRRQGKPL